MRHARLPNQAACLPEQPGLGLAALITGAAVARANRTRASRRRPAAHWRLGGLTAQPAPPAHRPTSA